MRTVGNSRSFTKAAAVGLHVRSSATIPFRSLTLRLSSGLPDSPANAGTAREKVRRRTRAGRGSPALPLVHRLRPPHNVSRQIVLLAGPARTRGCSASASAPACVQRAAADRQNRSSPPKLQPWSDRDPSAVHCSPRKSASRRCPEIEACSGPRYTTAAANPPALPVRHCAADCAHQWRMRGGWGSESWARPGSHRRLTCGCWGRRGVMFDHDQSVKLAYMATILTTCAKLERKTRLTAGPGGGAAQSPNEHRGERSRPGPDVERDPDPGLGWDEATGSNRRPALLRAWPVRLQVARLAPKRHRLSRSTA